MSTTNTPVRGVHVNEQGLIVVPDINEHRSVLNAMTPYNSLDNKYVRVVYGPRTHNNVATQPEHYNDLLGDWFFKGLSKIQINLKPNVVCVNPKIAPLVAFKQNLRTILADWSPAQEHKMAYLTYLCDMCCSSIEWTPAEK